MSGPGPGVLVGQQVGVEEEVAHDLARASARCREFFGSALRGLYVGGGYGRGEGGRRLEGGRWRPENDYDLFAVVWGGALAARRWRVRVAAELLPSLQSGQRMEYELGLLGSRALGRQRPCQMLYDLRHGHRCLWGDPRALLELPGVAADGLPAGEGLTLLVNRGALLLLATEQLAAESDPGAAVRADRWLHKARLAVGDGWLLLEGRHHHLLRVRAARVAAAPLAGLPEAEAWRGAHAAASSARLDGFPASPGLAALRDDLAGLRPAYARALRGFLARCTGPAWWPWGGRRRRLAGDLVQALDHPGSPLAGTFLRRWKTRSA